MSPCLPAGGQNLRNPAYVSAATRRAEKVLHFSGTERKVYKSNSCVARRWPVLHLANEKSVPFDVAPTRAWWESLLYRPLLHPSPFTERGPSSPAQASPSCPLLRYGTGPFSSIPAILFSISAILPISQTKWGPDENRQDLTLRLYSGLFFFLI